jgi:hypothetical protein
MLGKSLPGISLQEVISEHNFKQERTAPLWRAPKESAAEIDYSKDKIL